MHLSGKLRGKFWLLKNDIVKLGADEFHFDKIHVSFLGDIFKNTFLYSGICLQPTKQMVQNTLDQRPPKKKFKRNKTNPNKKFQNFSL